VKTMISSIIGFALLAMAPKAQATGTLDFTVPGGQPIAAAISYAGGANPLTGSDIVVTQVSGGGSPANSGATLLISNGVLSFTTGNFANGNGSLWNFNGGGTLTISGTIAAQTPSGYSSFGGTSGPLLSATFSSATVSRILSSIYLSIGLFFDPPDPTLASFFGLPPDNYQGFFNLSFNIGSPVAPSGAFTSSSVGSGDTETIPVPAPSSLVLFCSGGLAGLGGYAFRRWRRAAATAINA
jgi:hypothetical protein